MFHVDYMLARGAGGPLLQVEIAYCTRVVTEYPFAVSTRGRHLQLPDFVSFPDVKVAFDILTMGPHPESGALQVGIRCDCL